MLRKLFDRVFNKPKGVQLASSTVHKAARGIFLSHPQDFQYMGSIRLQENNHSTIGINADIFKEADGSLHILYCPGIDTLKRMPGIFPLKDIIEKTDAELKKKITEKQLANATKHLLIAETGSLFKIIDYSANHYVYACVKHGELEIEDSINRNYDVSNIKALFPNAKCNIIKRGWQNALWDKWQCGHYVLQALHREIFQQSPPKNLEITPEIKGLHKHFSIIGDPETKNSSATKEIVIDLDDELQDQSSSSTEYVTPPESLPSSHQPIKRGIPPIGKLILVGFAIGAGIAILTTLILASGGWLGVALGLGTAIGVGIGLTGATATGVGLTLGIAGILAGITTIFTGIAQLKKTCSLWMAERENVNSSSLNSATRYVPTSPRQATPHTEKQPAPEPLYTPGANREIPSHISPRQT